MGDTINLVVLDEGDNVSLSVEDSGDKVSLDVYDNGDNVHLVVEDRGEVVHLSLTDGGWYNNINDGAGKGDKNFTWSADKLVKEFEAIEVSGGGITQEELDEALEGKVDKQEGMGLSETSFSLDEKIKLLNISPEATNNSPDSFLLDRSNHTNTQPINTVEGLTERLEGIYQTLSTIGGDTSSLSEEVDSLKLLIQDNTSDIILLERDVESLEVKVGSHIKYADNRFEEVEREANILENRVSVISNKVDNKVDKVDGKQLSTEDYTREDKVKLSNIQKEATKNSTDAELRDRTTHTGVQPISTVVGLSEKLSQIEKDIEAIEVGGADVQELLDRLDSLEVVVGENTLDISSVSLDVINLEKDVSLLKDSIVSVEDSLSTKVDKEIGKGLSSNDFTDEEKSKLSSLEGSKYRGQYKDEASLPTTGSGGDYADVDGGVGVDVYRVIWDVTDNIWVRLAGESGGLSDAQIKRQYENNPDTNSFTDSEKNKLSTVENGATKNRNDSENANKVHSHLIEDVSGLSSSLDGKVDKEVGKGLSTNDYTSTDKSKLSGIENGATKNSKDSFLLNRDNHTGVQQINTVDGLEGELSSLKDSIDNVSGVVEDVEEIKSSITTLEQSVENKVDKEVGKGLSSNDFTTQLKDKIDSVQEGATKNSSDSHLLDRANHTGVQSTSTIEGLDSKLGEIDVISGSVEDLTTSINNKVDKESGKGLSSNDYTTHEKNKLKGIEDNATKNAKDEELRDRSTHTGTQPISSVSGLDVRLNSLSSDITSVRDDLEKDINSLSGDLSSFKEVTNTAITRLQEDVSHLEGDVDWILPTLDNKVDKEVGKQLSSNDFTDDEKQKLATIEGSKYRGMFANENLLPQTGNVKGSYADVDGGVGEDVYRLIWDFSDNKWVKLAGASSALTDAQIKQQYENNPDTNAFRDSDKSKLSSIESGATKNRSDNLNADKVHSHSIDDVSGLSSSLSSKVDKEVGKQLSSEDYSSQDKTKLQGIESGATKNLPDSTLLDRSNHTGVQPISSVEGLSSKLSSMDDNISQNASDIEGAYTELFYKVDKEDGKHLSSNDFTNAFKLKLEGVDDGATKNRSDSLNADKIHTHEQEDIEGLSDKLSSMNTEISRKISVNDMSITSSPYRVVRMNEHGKVDESVLPDDFGGVGELSDRVNSLETSVSNKVDKEAGKGLSSNDFTNTLKDKLSSIENEATKNRPDSENANKTHSHSINEVTGLSDKLEEIDTDLTYKVGYSDTTITSSPYRVLRLNEEGKVDSSVLPEVSGVSLGFGLSEDLAGGIQLGKEIPNTQGIAHGVDLDELGDDIIFGIGREFDQYGLLTRGIAFYKGNTFLREGNARLSVKQGTGAVEAGRSYSEDEVRMICSISLDSPISSVTTGDGRKFVVWDFDGSSGKSLMLIEDKKGYLFEQDFSKGSDSDYYHNARIVTLGYHKQKISELEDKINTLESTLNKLMYSIYGR